MSWSTSAKGAVDAVNADVGASIERSAQYDATLATKAANVATATGMLISAAASDIPPEKDVEVNCHGHVDHDGLSSFGLHVRYVHQKNDAKESAEAVAGSTPGSAAAAPAAPTVEAADD